MPAEMKGECDGSGAVHKGGVGIVGGLGARRNATAAGRVTWEDGRFSAGTLICRFKRCGAMWSTSTSGDS